MCDAEVGCEAYADELCGFGSARFALEEPQEESGDDLCSGFHVDTLLFFIEAGNSVDANVPQLPRDCRLPTPTMSSEGASPIPQTCLQPPY